jgi:putative ABC transport system permease protein
MDWRQEIRDELAKRSSRSAADQSSVVEELAQHADAAFQAARADGESPDAATEHVRALIRAWSAGETPRRIERPALIEAAPAVGGWMTGLGLDLRHALRLLARQWTFSVVAVLMIALGIGASTAIFSVVNGVLLTPLPWPGAPGLVRVNETREGGSVNLSPVFSNATYLAWQKSATTIDGLGGWSTSTMPLDNGDSVERVQGARVTPSLFPLLGVSPLIGPGLTADDATKNVMVLSHGFWRERFGGATDVVGRSLRIGKDTFTVAGVMPDGFMFPTPDVRFWLSMNVPEPIVPTGGTTVSLFEALARLKPGATPAQAAQEAQAAARTLGDLGPVIPAVFGSNGPALVAATPLAEAFVGDVRPALAVLLAAVTLLWLAAIGNVASMQMAHAVARRREVAIRAAIGAGRGRLARQLIVENGLLAVIGGALGIGIAAGLLRTLPALLPSDFPRAELIAIDGSVLAFAAALSIAASLVIAVWPSRVATSLNIRSAISIDAGAGAGSMKGALGSRRAISALQVAIAAMLLVGGGLLARSFVNQLTLDRGYDATNVLTARVQFPETIATAADRRRVYGAILDSLSSEPGVVAAGLSDSVPLGGRERRFASTTVDDDGTRHTVSALLRTVTPGYFAAIGMRLADGRLLEPTDVMASEPVVVVNRTFATKYLSASPIGQVLPAGVDSQRQNVTQWKVAGVLEDAMRASATDPPQPEIFVSTEQLTVGPQQASYLIVRTSGDPVALTPVLRRLVRAADTRAVIEEPMTMDARLMTSLARPRLYAILLGGFATFAALIALVGLFGGLSYGVTQRTREISLRAALGATPGAIVWLVVSEGAVLTVVGVGVGILSASAGARALGQYLYGVTTRDPLTYVLVAVVVLAVGLVASALPARRAAAIDPLKGLRS